MSSTASPATLPRRERAPKTTGLGKGAFALACAALFVYLGSSGTLLANSPEAGGAAFTFTGLLLFVPGILCIIFGHIALKQERVRGWKSNLSLAGLVLGYVMIAVVLTCGVFDLYYIAVALGQGTREALIETGKNLH